LVKKIKQNVKKFYTHTTSKINSGQMLFLLAMSRYIRFATFPTLNWKIKQEKGRLSKAQHSLPARHQEIKTQSKGLLFLKQMRE